MRCPKSRFPIWIIVFDELELIIFVSQGLTLSTASLVIKLFLTVLKIQANSLKNYADLTAFSVSQYEFQERDENTSKATVLKPMSLIEAPAFM